jgi:hypothetical protein
MQGVAKTQRHGTSGGWRHPGNAAES